MHYVYISNTYYSHLTSLSRAGATWQPQHVASMLRPMQVPLPRPLGSLTTTHCSDEMRISRGGRGGVFVLKRLSDDAG